MTIGGTKDLAVLRDADWVVEAVAERLDIKRALLARVEAYVSPTALVTSNTSGLSLAGMSAHLTPDLQRRFFGTHFLNPPRYLKLLEVIPTPATDPALFSDFCTFAENAMGHRVVVAKDTPGFISTRLWIAHLMDSIHTAIELGIDIELVDSLTGALVGRPNSATFRMADLVGLDIVASIARNQYEALPNDPLRERLSPPDVMQKLIAAGHVGEKTGAGFYRRVDGQILVLDLKELKYRPRKPVAPDLAHPYLDAILARFFDYARTVRPEIADSEIDVDHAFQWGFGWARGPLTMDAERHGGLLPTPAPSTVYLQLDHQPVLRHTETATLRDLGDGVACLEFHTKLNVFSPAQLENLAETVAYAERDFLGLVIGNQGAHFSAGYDLRRLVEAMERGDLSAIEREMKLCQDVFLALKYARIPLVGAPHGFTLGAGAECALHCARLHCAPETYFGLPEVAIGVIPCGGGVKERLYRLGDQKKTLDALLGNRNTTSAYEAQLHGWLREKDTISRNADRRFYEAKELTLSLADDWHGREEEPEIAPTHSLSELADAVEARRAEGNLTDHEARIGASLARVLGGGPLTESALLERERREFLTLCAEPLSLARMKIMLETGKPLRN